MLLNAAVALRECPNCHVSPFLPFLRGTVQRLQRPCYCALICSTCKEVVGYENPQDPFQFELRPKYYR
jgi:hypothetical protein